MRHGRSILRGVRTSATLPEVLLAILLMLMLLSGCGPSTGAAVEDTPSSGPQAPGAPETDDGPLQEREIMQADETGPEGLEPVDLTIRSTPDEAEVYLNNRYLGETPLSIPGLIEGRYKVELRRTGYRRIVEWIDYRGGDQSFTFDLERITGSIDLETVPAQAEASFAGEALDPGINTVPAGTHLLRVRAFGFETEERTVTVREDETTPVRVVLSEAEPDVTDLTVERRAFNPESPAGFGRTGMSFRVTAPGTGRLVVVDPEGRAVRRHVFPPFESWKHSWKWTGRSDDGGRLPDGAYTLRLELLPAEGGEPVVREEMVRIDRSLSLSYRSAWSGTSGLLYAASPDVLPRGSFQVGSILMGHLEDREGALVYRAPLNFSVRYGFGRALELDVLAGIILEGERYLPLQASGSLKFRTLQTGGELRFENAVSARITYQGNSGDDTFGNFTGFSVGGPTQLRWGPARLMLSPELVLSPYVVTYDSSYMDDPRPRLWMYLRGGLLLDFRSVVTGLSVTARTLPFARGLAIDPPVLAALEGHVLIPNTQLFISLAAAAEIDPEDGWDFMAGGGLGFLY